MSGYCKWCDTLTDTIIKVVYNGRLVWTGCPSCYEKRKKRNENEYDTRIGVPCSGNMAIETKIRPEPTRLTDVGKD